VRFVPLGIPGSFLLELEPSVDERGSFARTFAVEEFERAGLETSFVQWSSSRNRRRGTLRGLHWQAAPHGEVKLVRCVRGRIYDLALDLRPDSHIFRQHLGIELAADSGDALYLPPGVAHGFLTLEDECEVHYAMSAPYVAAAARGVRWNDPAFGIVLPAPVEVISERDRSWPDFVPYAAPA
jgi:dTDP-4-dehydrorhamnose 3,5-epimerase